MDSIISRAFSKQMTLCFGREQDVTAHLHLEGFLFSLQDGTSLVSLVQTHFWDRFFRGVVGPNLINGEKISGSLLSIKRRHREGVC